MTILKKFPKEDLLELIEGESFEDYTFISDKIVGQSRWTINRLLIFKHQEEFYSANYGVGATEQQEEYPWQNDGSEILCVKLVPVTKTVTVYVQAT